MNRNVLFLIIGALVVVAGILGYQVYKDRHAGGVEINVGKTGISIQPN